MKETAVPAAEPQPSWFSDVMELAKARLTFMVLVTTLAGFYLAAPGAVDGRLLFHTLLGTALVAASASALNQLVEREHDSRMPRTADRPLAARRRRADTVLFGALVVGVLGLVELAVAVNLLSCLLAAVTLASYVLVYTPMKRTTTLNTFVGAIPGAIPPVIGYTAVENKLGLEAALLFAILFFWQLPHFLAIAWMYRAQYRDAGFKMLTADDPHGAQTGRQSFLTATALLPVALLPSLVRLAGPVYFWGALILGLFFCFKAWQFSRQPGDGRARQLFFTSIIYLPLLLGLMAYDAARG
ncbi:MAG: heme o synthase [Verrucomicrobium sp.]|nr:heme o synthase [Verrucomicrobium sp.]